MSLQQGWSIQRVYAYMAGIYADANALTTPRHERLTFLTIAASDLSRCYRKELTHLYPINLAQIVAWYMSLGEDLFRSQGGIILAQAMSEKYPAKGCGYCNSSPCRCDEKDRPAHGGGRWSREQVAGWSLKDWQKHLDNQYGPANHEGGVPRAINRLGEEIGEIGRVLLLTDGHNDALDDIRRKIAREMTDVLAWTFALSSLLRVDLESALRTVYNEGCPVCRTLVCACRHFARQPISGEYTHRFMPAEEILAALQAA